MKCCELQRSGHLSLVQSSIPAVWQSHVLIALHSFAHVSASPTRCFPGDLVVLAFVFQIKRIHFYARVNRSVSAFIQALCFFIPWMTSTYRTGDMICTFLDLVGMLFGSIKIYSLEHYRSTVCTIRLIDQPKSLPKQNRKPPKPVQLCSTLPNLLFFGLGSQS